MSNIPIVFVSLNNNIYNENVLKMAKKHNEDVRILFSSNETYPDDIAGQNLNEYTNLYNHFAENVYKHMSTNSAEIELMSFKRIMVLYEYMKSNNINVLFYCDNSVLLNVNISELGFDISKPHYCIPDNSQNIYRWSASMHTSLLTLEFLENLIELILDTYQNNISLIEDKHNHHKTTNTAGGICDMTFLYLYSKDDEVINLLMYGFDHSINTDESNVCNFYKIVNNQKVLRIRDEKIYTTLSTDNEVILYSLNFPGYFMNQFNDYFQKIY